MREKNMSDNRSKFGPRLQYIRLDHFARTFMFVAGLNVTILGLWLHDASRFIAYTLVGDFSIGHLLLILLIGFPAWLAWLFVHIVFLVGFRNRVAVLLQWAWAYFTFNKGARLITRNFQAEQRPPT